MIPEVAGASPAGGGVRCQEAVHERLGRSAAGARQCPKIQGAEDELAPGEQASDLELCLRQRLETRDLDELGRIEPPAEGLLDLQPMIGMQSRNPVATR
jgi:hypothetical protein